jgi:hypothetical protein
MTARLRNSLHLSRRRFSAVAGALFLPLPSFFAKKERIILHLIMDTPPPQADLRVFDIRNGLVISDTGQKDADDFAADFQGLRHFADRVGAGLEMGTSLYASLHEPDFTFMYLLSPDSGAQPSNATGAMIGGSVSNNEMLVTLRQRNG